MSAGRPMSPQYDPSWVTGQYSNPANRGVDPMALVQALPSYSSWDQALADPRVAGMGTDADRTAYLQSLYGLGGNYGVRNGQIVSTDHSLRNGILGGTALIGGMSALSSLVAPASAPLAGGAAGGSAAGIGATVPATAFGVGAPTSTAIGATLPATAFGVGGSTAGAALPAAAFGTGVTGAGMSLGLDDVLKSIAGMGRPSTGLSLANLLVPTGTNLVGNLLALRQSGQASAMTNQYQQQVMELARQQQAEDERRYNQAFNIDNQRYADTRSDVLYRRGASDQMRSALMALLSPEGQMAWRSPSNVGRG
jgi:hypothetical protein